MKPVKTVSSNFVYRGPEPDIGDAWVERRPDEHVVYMVWELDDVERQAIAMGGQVKMGIFYMEPIPPVSLNVVVEEQVTDADPSHRIGIPRQKFDCQCPGREFGGHQVGCRHREAQGFA